MPRWKQTDKKREQIAAWIIRYRTTHDGSPTRAEIAARFNMTPQAVSYHINQMIDEGILDVSKVNGYTIPRSLQVVETEEV